MRRYRRGRVELIAEADLSSRNRLHVIAFADGDYATFALRFGNTHSDPVWSVEATTLRPPEWLWQLARRIEERRNRLTGLRHG